jgi:hypothetical protein
MLDKILHFGFGSKPAAGTAQSFFRFTLDCRHAGSQHPLRSRAR